MGDARVWPAGVLRWLMFKSVIQDREKVLICVTFQVKLRYTPLCCDIVSGEAVGRVQERTGQVYR